MVRALACTRTLLAATLSLGTIVLAAPVHAGMTTLGLAEDAGSPGMSRFSRSIAYDSTAQASNAPVISTPVVQQTLTTFATIASDPTVQFVAPSGLRLTVSNVPGTGFGESNAGGIVTAAAVPLPPAAPAGVAMLVLFAAAQFARRIRAHFA